jgi:hypothetical protein
MVLNATFNNILVISWRSVLLVDKTKVSRENHSELVFSNKGEWVWYEKKRRWKVDETLLKERRTDINFEIIYSFVFHDNVWWYIYVQMF